MTDAEDHEPELAPPDLVVVEGGADLSQRRRAVENPGKVLRLTGMVRGLLKEVPSSELDRGARNRLAAAHDRLIGELQELVSPDLRDELSELRADPQEDPPTPAELRVLQAQLSGWLEGLIRGVEATAMLDDLEAAAEEPEPGQSGSAYL